MITFQEKKIILSAIALLLYSKKTKTKKEKEKKRILVNKTSIHNRIHRGKHFREKSVLYLHSRNYHVNTIIGPHHKIHEKGSNLNTCGYIIFNSVYEFILCLFVPIHDKWNTPFHTHNTYKWLLNIEHGLLPWLISKKKKN